MRVDAESQMLWFMRVARSPAQSTHGFIAAVGVISQESLRVLMVWAYMRSERTADRMVKPGGAKLFNDLAAAIAMGKERPQVCGQPGLRDSGRAYATPGFFAGLGFGAMHTLMAYGALLSLAGGDEAFYLPACPQLSAFVSSAVVALLYNILHIALTVLALDALRRTLRWWQLVPGAVHLAFSLIVRVPVPPFPRRWGCAAPASYSPASLPGRLQTLLNESAALPGACIAVLPTLGVLTAAACALAVRAVAAPDYSARRQMRAWAAANDEACQTTAAALTAAEAVVAQAGGGGTGHGGSRRRLGAQPGAAAAGATEGRGDSPLSGQPAVKQPRVGATAAAAALRAKAVLPLSSGSGSSDGGSSSAVLQAFDIDSAGFGDGAGSGRVRELLPAGGAALAGRSARAAAESESLGGWT